MSSLALGALAILGIGGALAYFGPQLFAKAKDAITSSLRDVWASITGAPGRLLDAGGEALGYIKESGDYNLDPDRDAKAIDPLLGAWSAPFKTDGKTVGQLQKETAAAASAKRAKEGRDATIARLRAQKQLLEATGQEFLTDLEGGGAKITLASVNSQLAALGAA